MKRNRHNELEKSRNTEIEISKIITSAAIGVMAVWMVWLSTSLLLNIITL